MCLYNTILIATHIIGLLWNAGLCLSRSIFYLEWKPWEDIILWSSLIIVVLCHYILAIYGKKRALIIKKSLNAICVVEFVLTGIQMAYIGVEFIVSDFNVPIEAMCPLVFNCVITLALRLIWMKEMKKKESK